MNYPISSSQLWKYLPHRPPMVWVDEVIESDAIRAVGRLKVEPTGHYHDTNGFRQSSFIECMAQTFAFGSIANQLRQSANAVPELKEAFLVGVSHFEVLVPGILRPKELRIEVELKRQMGPLTLFDGVVFDEMGQKLATASMKVFANTNS